MLFVLTYVSEVWLERGRCEPVRMRNAEEYVVPASTLKSLWAILLLNELGEDYRIPTLVATKGNVVILRFNGDPYFKLRRLDSVLLERFKGIRGKTVYVLLSFPRWGERYGYGWAWDDIKFRLVSPITPISINGGRLYEDSTLNIVVVEGLEEEIITDTALLIPRNGWRYSDPLSVIGYVVRRAGERSGKRVVFEYREENRINLSGFSTDTFYSPPLRRMLKGILAYSSNFHMDMLVAHYSGGLINSGKAFRRFMGNLGMDTLAYVFDGSGLSRYNLIRAVDATYMLCAASRGKDSTVRYIFPYPGEGTLRRRLLEMRDMVYAKTGTLFGVSSLLGFYEGCNGNYVFGIYMQNSPIVRKSRDFIDSLVVWTSGGRECNRAEEVRR